MGLVGPNLWGPLVLLIGPNGATQMAGTIKWMYVTRGQWPWLVVDVIHSSHTAQSMSVFSNGHRVICDILDPGEIVFKHDTECTEFPEVTLTAGLKGLIVTRAPTQSS